MWEREELQIGYDLGYVVAWDGRVFLVSLYNTIQRENLRRRKMISRKLRRPHPKSQTQKNICDLVKLFIRLSISMANNLQ